MAKDSRQAKHLVALEATAAQAVELVATFHQDTVTEVHQDTVAAHHQNLEAVGAAVARQSTAVTDQLADTTAADHQEALGAADPAALGASTQAWVSHHTVGVSLLPSYRPS